MILDRLGQLRSFARGLGRRGPVYALVQITARCNLRCLICRVWTLERRDPLELSATQLARVAQVLKESGVSVVTLAGEPLLRPDLPEIVEGFSRLGMAVRIQTNGTLMAPGVMDALLRAGLSGISISLHGLDPGIVDEISCQEGTFERVLEGIEEVYRATRDRARFLRVINVVLLRKNYNELERLADFAASRGFRLSIIPLHDSPIRSEDNQFIRRRPPDLAVGQEDMARLLEITGRLMRRRRRSDHLLNSTRFLSMVPQYIKGGDAPRWPCLAGTLYLFVDHRGQVSPCHELDPVGSIFDPRVARSIREGDVGFTARETRKKCPGCLLPCWTELSLSFSHLPSFLEALEVSLRGAPAGRPLGGGPR